MSGGRLKGKVAIITGGGGGIGTATGRIFCLEGAQVALIDRTSAIADAAVKKIRQEVPNGQVTGFVADLADESAAQKVVDEVLATYNRLDVLVNNVAIRSSGSIADAQWDAWDPIMKVNLMSFVSMSRAALPALRQSGRGSIVNISSLCGVYTRKGAGAYDATKAAILALTRTIACEEKEHGIRANSICPGYVRTDYNVNRMTPARIDALVPSCVLQRWADPDELAYPVLWLASDEASYITATTLMVDGGFPLIGSI